MEKSATPEIIKKLQDLRQTRVKNYPLERYDIFISIKKFSPPIFRILNWLTFYSLVILHILHIDKWPTFKSKVILSWTVKKYEEAEKVEEADEAEEAEEDGLAKEIWQIWTEECGQFPRCGIILLDRETSMEANVLVIMLKKDDQPQYGYPKGGINIGESIRECAVREAFEELGCTKESIDDNINDEEAILKNIEYIPNQPLIQQYYFIVPVIPKDMHFVIDDNEVNVTIYLFCLTK
ncbi:unnamed protein product [Adineta steineri]|uniref:Nudix hydrolase domain-containing protein n=1 Tax=Adineta steineri TaxID=433720 RepID=A0A819JPL9_9BILA|nr:unnamed protein product [Adineta steineri]